MFCHSDECHSKTPYTDPVVNLCLTCHRPFRTYIPGTHCRLPDGGIVNHYDPQLDCPICDPGGFGVFMNFDLFPELLL